MTDVSMSQVETVEIDTNSGVSIGSVQVIELGGSPVTFNVDLPADVLANPIVDWFSGEGPPLTPIPGAGLGDMYLDTTTGVLYQLR